MRLLVSLLNLSIVFHSAFAEQPVIEPGFSPMFNGTSLEGWEGRTDLWSVRDGAIYGETTAENPLKQNTFLVWKGGEPANFELRAQFKIEGGNSGIQYRSKLLNAENFVVGGYQADIDDSLKFAGILYEEKGRAILAQRGEKSTVRSKQDIGKDRFADTEDLGKLIRKRDWNDYRIVAKGNRLQHFINDTLMSEVIDEDSENAAQKGVIALQIHTGPPMKVHFRNLRIMEEK
jgi:hypothetical protein